MKKLQLRLSSFSVSYLEVCFGGVIFDAIGRKKGLLIVTMVMDFGIQLEAY